jgi:hypothetical protein
MAVYCHTRPLVPDSRPMWKQSNPTRSPGWVASRCRTGSGSRRSGPDGCSGGLAYPATSDSRRRRVLSPRRASTLATPLAETRSPPQPGWASCAASRQPPGAEPGHGQGQGQGQGDDALLDPDRGLVGHPRRPPFPWPQDRESFAFNPRFPPVVGRAVKAQLPAGPADADLTSAGEQAQTMAVDQVIMGHGRRLAFFRLRHPKNEPPSAMSRGPAVSLHLVSCSP